MTPEDVKLYKDLIDYVVKQVFWACAIFTAGRAVLRHLLN